MYVRACGLCQTCESFGLAANNTHKQRKNKLFKKYIYKNKTKQNCSGISLHAALPAVSAANASGANVARSGGGGGGGGGAPSSSSSSASASQLMLLPRRRVHLTLELPWVADKAVQQLGRTNRAHQASGPKYVLLVSQLAGKRNEGRGGEGLGRGGEEREKGGVGSPLYACVRACARRDGESESERSAREILRRGKKNLSRIFL